MSKEDIDKAVREAERFAEEDKKAKENVETKNTAENLIFQSEKTLTELGDKVSESEKDNVKDQIEKLKSLLATGSIQDIKAGTEALQKTFYELSGKLYQQQGENEAPQDGGGDSSDDGYVNTEFNDDNQ